MNRFKNVKFLGVLYFSIILVFSLFYMILFKINTDSFILNNQLNLRPIHDAYEFLWIDEKKEKIVLPSKDLNTLQLKIDKIINRIENAKKYLKNIEETKIILKRKRKLLLEENSQQRDINIDKYKNIEKKLAIYTTEKTLIKELKILNSLSNKNNDLVIANKRVILSQVTLQRLEEDLRIATYILKHMGSFSDPVLSKKIFEIDENLSVLSNKYMKYVHSIGNDRGLMYEYLNEWSSERNYLLNFIDFFYYSVGISTTTTFGDITANSHSARSLVSLQLLLSVLVMGMFFNAISLRDK